MPSGLVAGDFLVFSGFCCGFQCDSVVGKPRETEEVITRNYVFSLVGGIFSFPGLCCIRVIALKDLQSNK